MPSARKLIAGAADDLVGPQVDREHRVDERRAAPPAAIATSIPSTQEPIMSAPQMPKKAPISIMPSSPMLITPAALGDDPAERARTAAAWRSAASPRPAPTR